jgi:hypothetical protein
VDRGLEAASLSHEHARTTKDERTSIAHGSCQDDDPTRA